MSAAIAFASATASAASAASAAFANARVSSETVGPQATPVVLKGRRRYPVFDAVAEKYPNLRVFIMALTQINHGQSPHVLNEFLAKLGFDADLPQTKGVYLYGAERRVLKFLINKAEEDSKFPRSHVFDGEFVKHFYETPLCGSSIIPIGKAFVSNPICKCCPKPSVRKNIELLTSKNDSCTFCIDRVLKYPSEMNELHENVRRQLEAASRYLYAASTDSRIELAVFALQAILGLHCNCTVQRVFVDHVLSCPNGKSIFQEADGIANAAFAYESEALRFLTLAYPRVDRCEYERLTEDVRVISEYVDGVEFDVNTSNDYLLRSITTYGHKSETEYAQGLLRSAHWRLDVIYEKIDQLATTAKTVFFGNGCLE